MPFKLDPRLTADTVEITRLPLSSVRLMNDARYPWLILVPMREDAAELLDLSESDRQQLWREIDSASAVLKRRFSPHKLNVAALGNMVRQLHVHVVARHLDDDAWPNPVWGHGHAVSYKDKALVGLCDELRQAFVI